jgi:hypothetical protein
MGRGGAAVAVAGAVLLAALAGLPAGTAEGAGAAQDSARADSSAADSAATAGSGGSRPAGETPGGFHPSYEITYRIEKDVRTLNNSFSIGQTLGEKLRLSNSSGVSSKDETTLKRKVTQQTTATSLEYLLSPKASLGVNFNIARALDNDRSQSVARETETKSSTIGIFSKLERQIGKRLSVRANSSAGTDDSKFRGVTETGTRGDIDLGLEYTPWKPLRASFSWSGSRSTNDAVSEEAGLARNRDITQTIRGEIGYQPRKGMSLRMELSATNAQFQYPDQQQKLQETRIEDRGGISLNASYDRSDKLGMQVSFSRGRSMKEYDIAAADTSLIRRRTRAKATDFTTNEAKANLNYSGWSGGTTKLALSRDRSDEGFQPDPTSGADQTKRIDHGGVLLSHEQKLFDRLKTNVTGRLDLVSYQFDRPADRRSDRDLFTRSLEVGGSYRFWESLNTRFEAGVKEDRTINIAAARSRENATKQSWWLQPRITLVLTKQASLTQSYEVRNDFTFFDVKESENFLTRKNQVDTGFSYKISKNVSFDTTHQFQRRDEGSFDRRRDILFRTGETSRQSLDISTGYSPWTGVRVSFGQRIEANRSYLIESGRRIRKQGAAGENVRRQFFGEMNVTREIAKKWSVRLSGRQTQTRGTSVSNIEKRFYIVDTTVSYKL